MKVAAKWQPIETAPLGKRVLVANAHNGHQLIASKMPEPAGGTCWFRDLYRSVAGLTRVFGLTHWQPLPDSPRKPKGKA